MELAKELNVTKQSVSNWENDNIQPSVEMPEKIANVFSVSIDYLLGNNPRECIDVSDLPAEVIAHIRLLIEDLKKTSLITNRIDTGRSSYQNESRWNIRRNELSRQEYAPNIYNCSLTICDGARRDPFKYICKYFNITADENTLAKFEEILNNFEAAEDGKLSLQKEKEKIIQSIQEDIPFLIKIFSKKKLEKNLGFEQVDLRTA